MQIKQNVVLKVEELSKVYPNNYKALKNISFEVNKGEFLVIIGLSGSGKSTMLRCINQLHPASDGKIWYHNKDLLKLKGTELRKARSSIGMIFQHFNLVPRKSVLTNVLTGSLSRVGILGPIFGVFPKSEREKALKYIEIVGLKGKEHRRADQLSGGQKQRVAIARALMQNPDLLLADEPVASLDPATAHSVMDYLKKVNKELGVTIICSLHFLSLVREYSDRVVALKSGEIIYEGSPLSIDEQWFKKIYGDQAREITVH